MVLLITCRCLFVDSLYCDRACPVLTEYDIQNCINTDNHCFVEKLWKERGGRKCFKGCVKACQWQPSGRCIVSYGLFMNKQTWILLICNFGLEFYTGNSEEICLIGLFWAYYFTCNCVAIRADKKLSKCVCGVVAVVVRYLKGSESTLNKK